MSQPQEEIIEIDEQYDADEGGAFIGEDDMMEVPDKDDEPYESDDEDVDGGDEDYEEEDRDAFEADPNLKDVATCVIEKHTDSVVAVAISTKDPQIIVTGSCDEKAYVYKVDYEGKSELIKEIADHTDTVNNIKFNFDSTLVATGSYDATIKIWNTEDWSLVQTLEGPADDIEWIDWHPRGNCIIAGSKDATAWMWWATNGKVMQVFTGHGDEVVAGAFGLSGKAVCTASTDGSAIVFNPRTGESTHTFDKKTRQWHQVPLASLATHATQPLMATGDQSGEVVITNIESGQILIRLDNHNHSLEAIGFSNWPHPPAMLLTAALDGTMLIRDCSRFDARATMQNAIVNADEEGNPVVVPEANGGFNEGITRAKWHPAGLPLVVTAGNDATARVYDARDGTPMHILTGHKNAILDIDIIALPNPGKTGAPVIRIATASDDKTVRVFDVPADRFSA